MNCITPKRGKRQRPPLPYGRAALRICLAVLLGVMLLANLFTHVFMVVRYYGSGMEPALTDRQVLLMLKTDKVEQGDVIAFYYNNKVLVRRVICRGGQNFEMDRTGTVRVDGAVLNEPYVTTPSPGQCSITFPYHVPMEHYFVMGDNRSVAMDSRLAEIGPVSRERIIGKVLWSF